MTITNCRQTCGILMKRRTTITRHQEDKQSKATRAFYPIEMIAKPECTQRDAQQKTEKTHHHLRTDNSQSNWGASMHFTGTKFSP